MWAAKQWFNAVFIRPEQVVRFLLCTETLSRVYEISMVETRRRVTVTTFYVAKTPDSGNFISSTTAQDPVQLVYTSINCQTLRIRN